jgi:hypothetical protein
METYTGAQYAFALKFYYKNPGSFVTARHLCRSNFEIHRNDPVPLPHATETRMKYFEATGSASAINPWSGYFLFCPRVCYCDSSH